MVLAGYDFNQNTFFFRPILSCPTQTLQITYKLNGFEVLGSLFRRIMFDNFIDVRNDLMIIFTTQLIKRYLRFFC